jgi:Tfp pilus assembly pilus retraction ATPase PilT
MNDSGEYSIIDLMELAVSERAGTLRCRTGEPPALLVEGEERDIEGPPVTAENAGAMLQLLAGPRRMRELWKNGTVEFEHDFKKLARFKVRANQAGEDIEFDLNMMG